MAAAATPLAGTTFGSAGPGRAVDATLARATDGDRGTYYDATAADGAVVGIDLGSPKAVRTVAIAPRAGQAYRMVGGVVQAGNDPAFASGVVTIATVKRLPADGRLTTIPTGRPTPYRYWRYVAPAGSYGSVAEFQLLGPPTGTAAAGTVLAGTATFGSTGDGLHTADRATDNGRSTYFATAAADGAVVGIDLGTSRTVDQVALAPRAGFAKRMVGGQVQASDDPTFAAAVATVLTVGGPPAGGRVTAVPTGLSTPYRYWRYVAPAGSYGNVAEFQLYAASATPTPTPVAPADPTPSPSPTPTPTPTPDPTPDPAPSPTPTPTPTPTVITVTPVAAQSATAGVAASFDLGRFAATAATAPYTVTVVWGDESVNTTFTVDAPGPLGTQSHTFDGAFDGVFRVIVADAADETSDPTPFPVSVTAPTPTPTPTPAATPNNFTKVAWTAKKPGPVARSEAFRATVGGKLYVFGGFDAKTGPMNRADAYDSAADSWTRLADLPEQLTHVGVAVDGTKVWIVGGYVGKGNNTFGQTFGTKHVWVYDTVANTYAAGPALPAALAAGGAAIVGRTLHYFGGMNLDRTDTAAHLTLNLDKPSAGWATAAAMPLGVNHAGAVALDGKVYAVGGQTGNDDAMTPQAVVQMYDPATNAWTAVAPLPAARSSLVASAFVMNGRLLVVGGESRHGVAAADCFAYTPAVNAWVRLTSLPTAQLNAAADVINGKLYVTSGGNTDLTYQGTPVTA